MTLLEAHEECGRWLVYLQGQKDRAAAMAKLAADARNGPEAAAKARIALRQLDRDIKVYDGARLAEAVRFLLKITGGKHFHAKG